MTDKLDDKGFLQRWSTRKADARADGDADLPAVADADDVKNNATAAAGEAGPDTDPQTPPDSPPQDLPPPDLPDVDTLDAASDYTGFLAENVPQDLAKMALRKLWRSDPLLANLDGLNDYDEDFSKAGMVTEVVKTAYRVGKGFMTDDDEAENIEAQDEAGVEAVADSDAQTNPLPTDASAADVLPVDVADDDTGEGENDESDFHNTEYLKPR